MLIIDGLEVWRRVERMRGVHYWVIEEAGGINVCIFFGIIVGYLAVVSFTQTFDRPKRGRIMPVAKLDDVQYNPAQNQQHVARTWTDIPARTRTF